MIRRIEIDGIGPHIETVIDFVDPMGSNEVRGESEVGKSTLIDAVCFALWGCDRTGKPLDIREVHDEALVAAVRLELASGTTVERILHRSKGGGRGKTTRSLGGKGYKTEKEWVAALATLGENWPALRQVMVPFAWVPLLDGQGHGRPLRDLLASILPKSDKAAVVRELLEAAGHEWHKGDPVHEADAKELRTRTNRQRDKATGDVERLEQLVAAGEAETTIAATVRDAEEARAIVAASKAWRAYLAERRAYVARQDRAASAADLALEWDDRLSELGDRPESSSDAEEAAKKRFAEATLRQQRTAANLDQSRIDGADLAARLKVLTVRRHPASSFTDAVNAARSAYQSAKTEAARATDVCPTCHREGWTEAKDIATALYIAAAADVAAIDQAYETEVEACEAARIAERLAAEKALDIARDEYKATDKAHRDAQDGVTLAQSELATAKASQAPGVEWDRARRALGDRPAIPATEVEPTIPKCSNPSQLESERAAKTVAEADEMRGASKQRGGDLDRLKGTLGQSKNGLELLRTECERLDALVDAVRRAPSEAARRELGALGDLGPVEVELRDDGGVEVLIDGRPHFLASTGKRIVADVWLRAGLRRAIGVAWLPVFVDERQSAVGIECPNAAPSISLTTCEGHLGVAV